MCTHCTNLLKTQAASFVANNAYVLASNNFAAIKAALLQHASTFKVHTSSCDDDEFDSNSYCSVQTTANFLASKVQLIVSLVKQNDDSTLYLNSY